MSVTGCWGGSAMLEQNSSRDSCGTGPSGRKVKDSDTIFDAKLFAGTPSPWEATGFDSADTHELKLGDSVSLNVPVLYPTRKGDYSVYRLNIQRSSEGNKTKSPLSTCNLTALRTCKLRAKLGCKPITYANLMSPVADTQEGCKAHAEASSKLPWKGWLCCTLMFDLMATLHLGTFQSCVTCNAVGR